MNPVSTNINTPTESTSPEEKVRAKAKAAAKLRRSLSCLVPIQPHGSKRPFFCIHPNAGVVFPYYELAFNLANVQPFYGLQSVGIAGKNQPLTSIEEMASHYIKAVRTVQPFGPYALGGWSLGGLIAFEMAQQLQRVGESVLLVSLDGAANQSNKFINSWEVIKFISTSVVRNIWPYVFDYLNLTPKQKKQCDKPKGHALRDRTELPISNRIAHIAQGIAQRAETAKFRQEAIRRLFPVLWRNTTAFINYKPQVYPGRMILLRSYGTSRKYPRYPNLGWSNLVQQGIEIHEIPGHHLNILRQPHVKAIAATLQACLDDN
ncbi:MAG: thioesterase domain-containing protein [Cyanobacteria bacterium J06635_10]